MKIVFPEGEDERIIKAVSITKTNAILIGRESVIKRKAQKLGIELENITIKEGNLETAMKTKADAYIGGCDYSTAKIIKEAIRNIGIKKGVKTISSYMYMDLPYPLILADIGVIPEPKAEQLAEIAIMTANNAKKLGMKPRVAMLSFSTKGSASKKFTAVGKVAKAVKIANKKYIDGEMQVDTALNMEIAKKKMKKLGEVAGKANILIFPDLASANISYKLIQHFTKCRAYGPILQGLKKPVSDLSRGSSVKDIVGVINIIKK